MNFLLQIGPADMPPIELLHFVREIIQSVLITLGVVIVGFPLARAFARRIDRRAEPPSLPGDVGNRLERIEQAVDAMAIEVERISEGQRFVTKMLAERSAPSAHVGERR